MIIGETTILMMAIPGGSRHLGQHLVVSLTIRQEAHPYVRQATLCVGGLNGDDEAASVFCMRVFW